MGPETPLEGNGVDFLFESESGTYRPEVFNHLVEREIRRSLRYQEFLVVLMVDPGDHVRRSSDPNATLRLVADNVQREIRTSDIVGRLDNVLGVALLCITAEDARLVARRLQSRVQTVIYPQGVSPASPAEVNIGGAAFPRGGSNAGALFQSSLDALRRAAAHPGGDVVIQG